MDPSLFSTASSWAKIVPLLDGLVMGQDRVATVYHEEGEVQDEH